MKIYHASNLVLILAGALVAVGCQAVQPSTPEEEAEEAAEELSANDAQRAPHRAHGPAGLHVAALHELDDLSAAQREAIEAQLASLAPPARDRADRDDETSALADAIRAGRVDPAAFAPPGDEAAPFMEGHGKVVQALDDLHATLTPAQRVALVEGIRAHAPDGRRDKGDRSPAPHGARGDHPGPRSPADFLLRGLEVDDAQRAKIDAALAEAKLDAPPARDDRGHPGRDHQAARVAMLDAFVTDGFDAGAALPPPPARPAEPPAFIAALAVVVPLLTDAQRATLADRVEDGPPAHHRKRDR